MIIISGVQPARPGPAAGGHRSARSVAGGRREHGLSSVPVPVPVSRWFNYSLGQSESESQCLGDRTVTVARNASGDLEARARLCRRRGRARRGRVGPERSRVPGRNLRVRLSESVTA
jgi:hypothetical protein